jgi:methylphosphotriester-DNA--protein-cysteine methyltransferase
VARFQNTLQRIRAEGVLSWDDYYDQAHMIREFKAFTGLTPSAFLDQYVR